MKRQKWTDHVFSLGIDPGWAPNIVTRLKGTELRLKHYTSSLTEGQCALQIDGAWSIKQHIGHLIDLEDLHSGRLREFTEMKADLSPADMSNARTNATDHNARSVHDLLNDMSRTRKELIHVFHDLPQQAMSNQAMHPRLKVLMRPVDLMFFVAEHDDHHLTTVLEIIDKLKGDA